MSGPGPLRQVQIDVVVVYIIDRKLTHSANSGNLVS